MLSSRLIQKAKSDPLAFGKVYEQFYDPVYKYVFFRVNSKELAEDLVGLIWEKALKSIAKLKSNHPLSFKLWLFQITRNFLAEHYQQKNNILQIEEIEIVEHEQVTASIMHQELNDYLVKSLQGFPQKERDTDIYRRCRALPPLFDELRGWNRHQGNDSSLA